MDRGITTSRTSDGPVVRPATSSDGELLFDLVQRFATSAKPDRRAFDLVLQNLISDPSTWLAVAEHDRGLTGYCLGFDHYTLTASGRVAWIEEIMVKSVWRRKGVGRDLLTAFESWARARGSRMAVVATREAWPFFEALDYEERAFLFQKPL